MEQSAPEYLTGLLKRHHWTYNQLAEYLGVPVNTVAHWVRGTRTPHSSAVRLINVLGMVEAMAPQIHDALMPEYVPYTDKPKRGRPVGASHD